MKLTVYEYPKCGTCRSAIKSLKNKGHDMETIHIFDHPPTVEQLEHLVALSGLELKKFFNTSGEVYKEMNLKDKLPSMTRQEQLRLLASNGRLIKRPIVTDGKKVTVGLKEEQYAETWKSTT